MGALLRGGLGVEFQTVDRPAVRAAPALGEASRAGAGLLEVESRPGMCQAAGAAEWPEPRKNPDHNFKLVIQKGLSPSSEEVKSNPRARSARLRVAERLPNLSHA